MSQPNLHKYPALRIAGSSDANAITAVINSAFRLAEGFFVDGDRITTDEVIDSMSTGSFLLAEDEGGLVGCVYVEPRGERAYLGLLSVDPSRQQSGIGTLLVTAAEDHCIALNCRFMDIKIVNLRDELPAFYGRRGYIRTGTSSFPLDVETKLPCYFIDMTKALVKT
jgi:predicted N-acetyltransferase YhbS